MAILDQVRARLTEAIKAKSDDKDVYRLLMAKCQTDGAKTDDEAITCVRALINGNLKAIEQTQKEAAKANMVLPPTVFSKLEAENKVLATFLPQYLDAEAIRTEILADEKARTAVAEAKNDGAAVGVAMGIFKAKDLKVEGKTVKDVVASIRSGN